ncbi:MAG: tetratricopeptide repeat protein [Vicinamibacteria bacterium]
MNAAGFLFAAALAASTPPGPVMVAPPEGPEGSAPGWIGAAVSVTLPRALQRAGVAVVPDIERRRAQEALGAPAAVVSRATNVRTAEALGASRLVVGSWDLKDGEVTLALRLLDVERGALSAPLVGHAPLQGLGGLVHTLAWDVALAGAPPPPPAAREALQKAGAELPFEALRALAEGMAARDAASQVAGARRALAERPGYEEAALALAQVLVEAGDFDGARQALAAVAPGSPFARDARFLDGVALLGLRRFREADVLYAALAAEAETAAALGNRAIARLRAGGAGGASTLLRRAMEVEPASLELPFDLGWALLLEGEPAAAAFWLKAAVRRDPGDAQGRLLLSWAYANAHLPAEAEEQFRAAVALTPTLDGMRAPDLSRRLERVFLSEHGLLLDPDRAADVENARAHASRGESLLAAGDAAGALTELARAALLDPFSPGIRRLLSRARAAQGEAGEAIEELRRALWCREDPDVRRDLAARLEAAGRAEDAKRVLAGR